MGQFFCLENEHWRIIGIDTGYHSTRFDWGKVAVFERSRYIRKSVHFKPRCTIPEPLLRWLIETVKPDGDPRGLIVLSHHGGFSSFSDWYQIPPRQLAEIIHRPVIWFWGHEHKVAIYDRFAVRGGIPTYGRCVGHGGMPVDRGIPTHGPMPIFYDNRLAKNGYGVNGFVNLTFAGPRLIAEYDDLDGSIVLREEWAVDANGSLKLMSKQKLINDTDFHA